MANEVIIRRYPNRRLYDSTVSAYITLEQVAALVREGKDVKVVEASSGEDVTAYVLTQILLEEAKKKKLLLPVPLLHLIIRYGDTVLAEFFDKYLQEAIKNFVSYKALADDQFRKWMTLGFDLSKVAHPSTEDIPDLKPFFDLFATYKEKKSGG